MAKSEGKEAAAGRLVVERRDVIQVRGVDARNPRHGSQPAGEGRARGRRDRLAQSGAASFRSTVSRL